MDKPMHAQPSFAVKLFTFFRCCTALWVVGVSAAFAVESPIIAWSDVSSHAELRCELTSNGRDRITVGVANTGAASASIDLPAGLICALAHPAGRVISLRGARLAIPAGGSAEAELPAAALSLKTVAAELACTATEQVEPKLAALLTYLSTRPDVPRATTQLAVLSLLEDVTFAQWQTFLIAGEKTEPARQPTPAEVVQAVDALSVLREAAPGAALALASDPELKLRALRNPWARAKAMQLYGIALPGDGGDGAVAPEVGQLLHRVTGDNCPVCRLRARMQGRASDF